MQNDYHAKGTGGDWLHLTIPGPDWELRGPLTPAEATAEHTRDNEPYFRQAVERGAVVGSYEDTEAAKSWAEFVSQHKDGDELYWYCSSRRSWAELVGKMGYILIRGDRVIGSLVTLMN